MISSYIFETNTNMIRMSSVLLLFLLAKFTCLQGQRCIAGFSEVVVKEDRQSQKETITSIPVVIHLLYKDDSQWVSDQAMISQIDGLSKDFRRQNLDTVNTPMFFRDIAADTRIEFCFAELDPTGNLTNGIEYRQVTDNQIGLTDHYYQSPSGLKAWDSHRYLNIWVCEIETDGAISGFSTFPEDAGSEKDGVVIDYRFFGGDSTGVYGRTLTHEVGHWLGLNHIWGKEMGCSNDDGVEDTPDQLDAYRGCPTYPQQSCGSIDMFMNFMDLTADTCVNLFTVQQAEVMHEVLQNQRENLSCTLVSSFNTSSFDVLRLFPNPARDEIHIDVEILSKIEIWSIADQSIVLSQVTRGHLNISSLPSGIYLVKVWDHNKPQVARFIKL